MTIKLLLVVTLVVAVKWCHFSDQIVCVEENATCPINTFMYVSSDNILLNGTNANYFETSLFCEHRVTLLVFYIHPIYSSNLTLRFDNTHNYYHLTNKRNSKLVKNTITKNTQCVLFPNCNICTTTQCTECAFGYYISGNTCSKCDSNCLTCVDLATKCVSCQDGLFLNTNTCGHCPYCDDCTGNECNKCSSGYHNTYFKECQKCEFPCLTCTSSTIYNCDSCVTNYYVDKRECKSCGTNCNSSFCFDNIGCTKCNYGFYVDNGVCNACDPTCKTCQQSSQPTACLSCYEGYYLTNSAQESQCLKCDLNCAIDKCVNDVGCTQCLNGFYMSALNTCTLCDSNCKTCDSISTFCTSCVTRKFLMNGKCVNCDENCDLNFCVENIGCTKCKETYILTTDNKCTCPKNNYQNFSGLCDSCYNGISNCLSCSVTNSVTKCHNCYPPYEVFNGNCIQCDSQNYFYKGICKMNENECISQLTQGKCQICSDESFLIENECVYRDDSTCLSSSKKTCEECESGISSNGNCGEHPTNCKYNKKTKLYNTCLQCKNNFFLTSDNRCELTQHSETIKIKNNVIFQCDKNQFLDESNTCQMCFEPLLENSEKCIFSLTNKISLKCSEKQVLNYLSGQCENNNVCLIYYTSDCTSCPPNYVLASNKCSQCDIDDNCLKTNKCVCILCSSHYLLQNGKCIESSIFKCLKSDGKSCLECEPNYLKVTSQNIDNFEQLYCLPIHTNAKYNVYSKTTNETQIVECSNGFYLFDSKCEIKLEDITKKLFLNYNYSILENDNRTNNKKDENIKNCVLKSTKGCLKCAPKYFLDSQNVCKQCENGCENCFNSTHCLTCNSSSFLNSQSMCEESSALGLRCNLVMPQNKGCALCKDGYYQQNLDCRQCDKTCSTCLNDKMCLSCKDGYYQILSESALCQDYTTLTHCLRKTKFGCAECEANYFINSTNFRCDKCPEGCEECLSKTLCLSCSKNYIFSDLTCFRLQRVEFCQSASDGVCTSCSENKAVSSDGLSCEEKLNLAIVISLPIIATIVIIIIVVVSVTAFIILNEKHKQKEMNKNVCIFNMKHSNVQFTPKGGSICSNKDILIFDNENNENNEIAVLEENRQLICIGNCGKHKIKIQFTTKNSCDVYEIRTSPKIVSLDVNLACEFEVYLTPNFTSKIEDKIACVILDLEVGKQDVTYIPIRAFTTSSTRLDYHELNEEKKLGEGSFGIVYKGEYRGNVVAIKKLKHIEGRQEESIIDDFENEINMLDKFRSEYIVYFYGAVCIPNKVCLVTEFAPYGSLQDLMKQRKSEEVVIKIRIKMMLDAAKGICYLHTNGILHRDIKPDNILVFSLDLNTKVNGKLTDFGSARNVNLIMTNMTFTKGIGTPIYMAPEILQQENYRECADIYSFAITMFEVFGWCEAYPKEMFKFPWNIAEMVTSGKRLEKKENMSDDQYNLIQQCWKHNSSQRMNIENVVEQLQEMLN
ncbi:protein serine/threonine kinase, putative [Entamoeba invadens IP1]|uniref:Protein serine/threonine kinase, putative n=1 Tax=Entamoeba invadens IP1 TaxID=370355 RepID=A0A0A1TUV8_ENTIV|nr:protein serine/threonine kinase, putative [Entamoeba invadens IP1]ELP83881.1 protein serine/threonine kinase, putative [Entamoeba invadens IP1]|eukprot:XP_004183227.1 protein serine/threonine kinase, putative [Entamoeba invadens IP1]